MSKFLRHEACPECGSSDGLAVYSDNKHCFVCDHHERDNNYNQGDKVEKQAVPTKLYPLPTGSIPGIRHRYIDPSTVQKYKVTNFDDVDSEVETIFPRFDEHGQHVHNQIRLQDKEFRSQGDSKAAVLFGQTLFPSGGRSITITEGYYDTMSAFQLTGSRFPNVGVQSASSAKQEAIKSFEYLNSFGEIVINFDNDEPGQKAAKEVAILFDPGKVRILKLEKYKDANDYLVNGYVKEFVNEWHRAPVYMPDGLLLGTQMWDEIENHKTPHSVPYPWQGLNDKTYGLRRSEFVLITADTGVGKTSICKEIEYSLLMNPELIEENVGVGFLHFEEPKYDTAIGLMSIHANKPFHLPDVERTVEELRSAYDAVINNDRVVIWDHFGSNDIDVVLAKIRHMAALGCRYIVLDHLSIVVSDQSGDERKQLDEISTKLKTLTMNLDISCICVIHINRKGEVRGSAGPEQVSNIVMRLERDKKELDPFRRNVTRITIEKNRFCGRTGPACYLYYNDLTNRLEELTDPEVIMAFENGTSMAGHEFDAYGKAS
jgi:twinkle protein